MANPRFPSVDENGKIRDAHLPERLAPEAADGQMATLLAQPGTLTRATVDVAISTSPRPEPMPGDVISMMKGSVGTSGAVPISLRFDDWHNVINQEGIATYMKERAIVWSLVCISRINQQAWFTSAVTPWPTVQGWVRDGAEIWSHGTDHETPWDDNPDVFYDNLVDQIANSKKELEAWRFRVMGFSMPGVPAPGYGSYLVKESEWKTPAGRLLQENYGLVETDMHGAFRELPSTARYGLAHLTISDGNYNSLSQLQGLVNRAVRTGTGLEMMIHAGSLIQAGRLPLAIFKSFLDWLVVERDAGRIEIVTPSTLPFCDPRSTHRPDLLGDNDFSNPAATDPLVGGWSGIDGTAVRRATVHDGPIGRTATVVRITAPDLPPVVQTPQHLRMNQHNGVTMMVQLKARAVTAPATLRVGLRALAPYVTAVRTHDKPLTTEWQTIRIPYTLDISADLQEVALSTVAGSVEVTDVHMYIA